MYGVLTILLRESPYQVDLALLNLTFPNERPYWQRLNQRPPRQNQDHAARGIAFERHRRSRGGKRGK